MIVADASAVVGALLARPALPALALRLTRGPLHGPHLLDVEVLHALRRLVARGQLEPARADDALGDFGSWAVTRYPHWPLRPRMWELRHNLSAYDAAYVALAEALEAPLVTADARLAAAPGHHARVEVFAA